MRGIEFTPDPEKSRSQNNLENDFRLEWIGAMLDIMRYLDADSPVSKFDMVGKPNELTAEFLGNQDGLVVSRDATINLLRGLVVNGLISDEDAVYYLESTMTNVTYDYSYQLTQEII